MCLPCCDDCPSGKVVRCGAAEDAAAAAAVAAAAPTSEEGDAAPDHSLEGERGCWGCREGATSTCEGERCWCREEENDGVPVGIDSPSIISSSSPAAAAAAAEGAAPDNDDADVRSASAAPWL